MGGGLLQLVAYGAQDVYLSGNPQITFFKVAYRRHTNFSMESIEQTFNGVANFGRRVTCQISRNGDLIHRMYLQVSLKDGMAVEGSYAGLALIKSVELEIGGQRIDKQYGDWMYIWNELTLPSGKKEGFDDMVGGDGFNLGKTQTSDEQTNANEIDDVQDLANTYVATLPATTLYVPLEFWFCRNPGLALPLIALQYHEVKVNLEFAAAADAGITAVKVKYTDPADEDNTFTYTSSEAPKMTVAALWVDYVFLDTDERRRFAQLSHEYLIEQLQFTGEENVAGSSNKIKLNFNHPVKELVWVMQQSASPFGCYDDSGSKANSGSTAAVSNGYVRTGMNLTESANIQLNGHDRFAVREGKYFNRVQPFQHHTNVPSNKGINVYSFALKPEEHQPSGTLNFSRIDSAILSVKAMSKSAAYLNPSKIRVYAVNYNVLRVMSGMGGLAYSN